MRVFIAVDIAEQVKKTVDRLRQELKEKLNVKKSDVKWSSPQASHLTLKFLGEVRDDQIVTVCDAVQKAVAEHKGFDLDIRSVGSFGGNVARVLWIGTSSGSRQLCSLQKDIEDQLSIAGWPNDMREFSGHLTLCRIKSKSAGIKLAQLAKGYSDFEAGTTMVDSVVVYQSQLTSTGPVYTVIENYKLL